MTRRALSPVVGVAVLLVVTLAFAGVVGTATLGTQLPPDPPNAAISVTANADADRLSFLHRTGDPLNVSEVDVHVTVNGTPLRHQPPVPFFAARGFRSGPTGPFNSAADSRWESGETATVQLAGTNTDVPSDAEISVRLSVENVSIATARTTAR